MYSPADVVLAPDRKPTPLSREYLEAPAACAGRINESRDRVGLASGEDGKALGPSLERPAGGPVGRLATRWPPRGGWGKDEAIETERFGADDGVVDDADGVSRVGPDRGVA